MALVSTPDSTQPMGELNTTPLIDVLLVLLILFVITIPAATHSVELALPADPGPARLNPTSNRVLVTAAGVVLWNGTPVSQRQLAGMIGQGLDLPVEPSLEFEAEAAASYDLAARTIRTIKLAGATNIGMVGNSRYADFGSPR